MRRQASTPHRRTRQVRLLRECRMAQSRASRRRSSKSSFADAKKSQPLMAGLGTPAKAPTDRNPGNFSNSDRIDPETVVADGILLRTMPAGHESVSAERSHIYILLCMFNGFAFARPLCGAIKGASDGG